MTQNDLEEKIADVEKHIECSATDFVRLNELCAVKKDTEEILDKKMERYFYLEELAEKIKEQSGSDV